MDEFDDMFNDVGADTVKKEEATPLTSNDNGNNYGGGNNYNNNNNYGKKKFDNKPVYTNVEGKQTINVWNGDRVEPLELDHNSLRTNTKWCTIALGNKFYKLDEDHVKRFRTLASKMKEKGYKCRVICSNVAPILKDLKEIFGDDLMLITPWKGYCKELKDFKQYLSSDSNLKAASYYFNNKARKYNDLAAGIKLVKSAVIASLVGLDNNELSQIVIIHDRNYDGKKIDFKQSQQTSDYILLAKPLNLTMYNIAFDKDYGDLSQLLG